jgi:uncharacterized glyoxalase superfamily protein PhnB
MGSAVIPGFRYADAPGAIAFLCGAFGFTRHAVYADPDDPAVIHHAELTLGGGMVMLGTGRDEAGMRTPAEAGGETASIYVVVADPDAHCAQARAAGAAVVKAPHANDGYSGRSYSARDPEGRVWQFGSYDPWASR